jgi:hypothetical protein
MRKVAHICRAPGGLRNELPDVRRGPQIRPRQTLCEHADEQKLFHMQIRALEPGYEALPLFVGA